MHALVTGGAGFIGSHLAEFLVSGTGGADAWRVTIVDDLSTGRRENLDSLPPDRFRFIHATVAEALPELRGERFDRVFHLADAVGVDLVLERPVEVIESGVRSALAVLLAAMEWGCPVLMASSSEVYGKSTRVPFREDDEVIYGPTSVTRWSYAYAKAAEEFLALAFARRHGLPVVVARFFNTVGPRQVGTWGMVLPRFVEHALAGRPLPVFGDGRQARCFCDARDVVAVLPALLDKPSCHGRVFNVGSDEPISIVDLARGVIAALHSSSEIALIPYEKAYADGFEDVSARQPDLTRLHAETGFAPRITLEQTIRDIARSIRPADFSPHQPSTGKERAR